MNALAGRKPLDEDIAPDWRQRMLSNPGGNLRQRLEAVDNDGWDSTDFGEKDEYSTDPIDVESPVEEEEMTEKWLDEQE